MLSIKVVLVSACLASAVYGNPTFDLSGIKKDLGGVSGAGDGLFGEISDGPIGELIHAIVGGVDAKLATDADLLKNLLTLNIPGAFKDIFHFFTILEQTFSNIVGSIFPEFGVACQGLSQTCTRITSCLLGGGFGNVDCNGLSRGHGKGPVDMTKYSSQLGLDKIRKQVQAIISRIENQGGNLSGSQTVVISLLQSWMSLFEKKSFGVHDVSKSITIEITIMASICESRKAGYTKIPKSQLSKPPTTVRPTTVTPGPYFIKLRSTDNSGVTFAEKILSIISSIWKKSGYPDISLDDILPKLKNTSDNCDCWSKADQGNNGSSGQGGNENGNQESNGSSDKRSSQSGSNEDNQGPGRVPCLD